MSRRETHPPIFAKVLHQQVNINAGLTGLDGLPAKPFWVHRWGAYSEPMRVARALAHREAPRPRPTRYTNPPREVPAGYWLNEHSPEL